MTKSYLSKKFYLSSFDREKKRLIILIIINYFQIKEFEGVVVNPVDLLLVAAGLCCVLKVLVFYNVQ